MATRAEDLNGDVEPAELGGSARFQRRHKVLLVAIVLGALAALLLLEVDRRTAERRALSTMDAETRGALYEETRHTGESVCAQARTNEAFQDRCADLAEFLASFPECDDACRAFAASHKHSPTR